MSTQPATKILPSTNTFFPPRSFTKIWLNSSIIFSKTEASAVNEIIEKLRQELIEDFTPKHQPEDYVRTEDVRGTINKRFGVEE